MPTVRARRLLNAVELGTVSGAQLETYLADAGRLAEWSVLVNQRSQIKRISVAPQTMASVCASARAMGQIVQSSYAMQVMLGKAEAWSAIAGSAAAIGAIIAYPAALAAMVPDAAAIAVVASSSAARGVVVASSAAMAAFLGDSVTRGSFYGSDAWITSISGSATAKAAMRACATYQLITTTTSSSANTPVSIAGIAGNTLMVGWSQNGGGSAQSTAITGRRSGSSVGSLTAVNSTISGTTAQFDNVMAITSPATVANGSISIPTYFGIVPV